MSQAIGGNSTIRKYTQEGKALSKLTVEEIIKTTADVTEIQGVLIPYQQGMPLDRKKAEQIIRKHNSSDYHVALMNSPGNPGYVTFEQATDQMVAQNLANIQLILGAKLAGKSIDELMNNKQ